MSREIKVCPECGTYANAYHVTADRLLEFERPKYFVECQGCFMRGPRRSSKALAITVWNRRAMTDNKPY